MFKIYSMNMAGLSFWGSNVKALHMFLVHSVIYLGTRNKQLCFSKIFTILSYMLLLIIQHTYLFSDKQIEELVNTAHWSTRLFPE